LKAPLIAVLSVGIAAAAPAVAISAATPNDVKATKHVRVAPPAGINPAAPIGTLTPMKTTSNDDIRHRRLEKRFLKAMSRLNRLIARRDGRKARKVRAPAQLRWSDRGLRRAIRVLRKRTRRVRAELRDKRAGLTPGVRAILERIASCESHGNPRAIGGGGAYRGKYQFSFGTWASVGGKGDPARASEAEQDRRATMLLARGGRSHWPVCG
jgi:Transglycosylase-like domain